MAPLVQLPFLQTANFSKIRSVCLDMAADCLPPELKLEAENTMAKTELLYPQNWGAINFTQNEYSGPRTIEKNKILGAVSKLPAKQHRQFGPFGPFFR
jgi:hypothetical protein